MRNFLFLDIETTGLPLDFNGLIADGSNWPRVVELAFVVTDPVGKAVYSYSNLIKPDGWKMGATDVHGITQKEAEQKGVSIKEALIKLSTWLKTCRFIVAHNIDFDLPVLQAEYYRLGLPHPFTVPLAYCTQKQTADIVKIKKEGDGFNFKGYEWPSLKELAEYCDVEWTGPDHRAFADAVVTMTCFWLIYDLLKDAMTTPYYYKFKHQTPGDNSHLRCVEKED